MLSGLIYPSAGDARVLGFTPWKRERAFLKQISILLGQKNQLWWDIPAADSYELLIRIYDLEPYDARQRIKHLSELLECSDLLHIQLRRLSLGERMKMEIIASLLHRPRVLFLDEPTIGLDVVAQKSIRSFLSEYVRTEGPTVLLTSHYMDDIATLADRLLLISGGTLQYDGTVKHFMSATEAKQRLTVNLTAPLPESVHLTPEIVFEGGQEVFTADLKVSEVPRAIAELTSRVAAREIRLEEADFEDVIRQFLESESRVLSARNR
jgi:ABC-2 type transport system ATP-binding protein